MGLGCAGVLLWVSISSGAEPLLGALATYVSPDHHISAEGRGQLLSAQLFLMASSCLAGIVCWQVRDAAGWIRLRSAFLREPFGGMSTSRTRPSVVLAAFTAIGAVLIIHINLYSRTSAIFATLYFEDGVFETLTVVALIGAASCLAVAVRRFDREPLLPPIPTGARLIFGLLVAAFVVLAGEELSWGQRLFGWQTPAGFPAGNTQGEFNVHNFFTNALSPVYRVFILLPVPVLLCLWLAYTERRWPTARLTLPHPSLIGLSVLIAFVAAVRPQEQELLEELFALFALAYGISVLRYAQPPHDRSSAKAIHLLS